jgi:predicted esterase
VILIHGRGATADDILGLGEQVSRGVEGVSLLAPQAEGNTWYPARFLAPIEDNEPYLSSALSVLSGLVREIEAAKIPASKVILAGFSQGACLALEYAARNPRRYGGIVGLSGALIGPPGTPRNLMGNLAGTPVYLGCSDRDAHIPLGSVEESAAVFQSLKASVTKSIFPGMGHTVNAEELSAFQAIVNSVAGRA